MTACPLAFGVEASPHSRRQGAVSGSISLSRSICLSILLYPSISVYPHLSIPRRDYEEREGKQRRLRDRQNAGAVYVSSAEAAGVDPIKREEERTESSRDQYNPDFSQPPIDLFLPAFARPSRRPSQTGSRPIRPQGQHKGPEKPAS